MFAVHFLMVRGSAVLLQATLAKGNWSLGCWERASEQEAFQATELDRFYRSRFEGQSRRGCPRVSSYSDH